MIKSRKHDSERTSGVEMHSVSSRLEMETPTAPPLTCVAVGGTEHCSLERVGC